ncbi:hypothetical protein DHEL01_v206968 [Diaporthe helianthi]|uniref:Uncharacterized protein n=1 Tax=Diaporthe helianthi TaxID=158607 RepID=A0A2P5HWN2_DIAHE|nr:hypothetical protein DHEL01_v206968 [Diaporthe helianthi]
MPSTTDSAKSGPTNKTSTRSNGLAEVPAGATVVPNADNNYDEAPPGVTGPDQSARDTLRKQAKPVFNRGPSMLDFTAITSAGPTPAGELPPSASYFDGSRLRESHLPDEEDLERMRRQTVAEIDSELPRRRVPGDEVQVAMIDVVDIGKDTRGAFGGSPSKSATLDDSSEASHESFRPTCAFAAAPEEPFEPTLN